ncbi:MAG: hypothetical protein K8I82_10955, partial [Anaerolineae bacterium]|nr:hypothetical protein [Anaerolineae bacterium]
LDLGAVTYDKNKCHFLNIASVGISGEVDYEVNRVKNRRPWTYKLAAIKAMLHYTPPVMTVKVDGKEWYKGRSWLVVVANGIYFGKGMAIAPQARVDDGMFEVVLVKEASRMRVLRAFNTVYSGKHLQLEEVQFTRGRQVEVISSGPALPLDLDGEHEMAREFHFEIKPGALQMLYE